MITKIIPDKSKKYCRKNKYRSQIWKFNYNKSWKWIRNKYFKEDYYHEHDDNYILTCPDEPKIQLNKIPTDVPKYSVLELILNSNVLPEIVKASLSCNV